MKSAFPSVPLIIVTFPPLLSHARPVSAPFSVALSVIAAYFVPPFIEKRWGTQPDSLTQTLTEPGIS